MQQHVQSLVCAQVLHSVKLEYDQKLACVGHPTTFVSRPNAAETVRGSLGQQRHA
jgi:hypothetical protein